MKNIFVLLSCFISFATFAKVVTIKEYRHQSWKESWSDVITSELSKENYQNMISLSLDPNDLEELSCLGYNSEKTNSEERKQFWVVFFSSLVRSESAFHPKARSKAPKGGHGNYGLLQLSKRTGRDQCQIQEKDIFDIEAQLKCGVKLMNWQLAGAPVGTQKKLLRPDLVNQLFGKKMLLWGPLRQNDHGGRARLVNWFKSHLDQMPFCQI
jgi:hypothetical protein